MSRPSRPQYEHLPPHVKTDPAMIAWRLDQHEERLTELEAHPHMPRLEGLPWGQIIMLLMVAIGGLSGLITPGEVKFLLFGGPRP